MKRERPGTYRLKKYWGILPKIFCYFVCFDLKEKKITATLVAMRRQLPYSIHTLISKQSKAVNQCHTHIKPVLLNFNRNFGKSAVRNLAFTHHLNNKVRLKFWEISEEFREKGVFRFVYSFHIACVSKLIVNRHNYVVSELFFD